MKDEEADLWFQAFDGPSVPLGDGVRATPRPAHRPRDGALPPTEMLDGVLVTFTDTFRATTAGAVPSHARSNRPRATAGAETDIANELAGPVLEYVRTHPTGTVEELAALMRQLLARRSA
jgi:hypothetical protein